jgi:hypothetical protein
VGTVRPKFWTFNRIEFWNSTSFLKSEQIW